jgi:hypothetical protein
MAVALPITVVLACAVEATRRLRRRNSMMAARAGPGRRSSAFRGCFTGAAR